MQKNIIGLFVLFLLYLTVYGQEGNKHQDSVSSDTSQTVTDPAISNSSNLDFKKNLQQPKPKRINQASDSLKQLADNTPAIEKNLDPREIENLLSEYYVLKFSELKRSRESASAIQKYYESSLSTVTWITTIIGALITIILLGFGFFGIKRFGDIEKKLNQELETRHNRLVRSSSTELSKAIEDVRKQVQDLAIRQASLEYFYKLLSDNVELKKGAIAPELPEEIYSSDTNEGEEEEEETFGED